MNKILDLYKRINFYGSWWDNCYTMFLLPTITIISVEGFGLKIFFLRARLIIEIDREQ